MHKTKKTVVAILAHAFILVFIFLYNLPTISMVGTALKSKQEALSDTSLFPKAPTLSSILTVFRSSFLYNLGNSAIVAVVVCLLCITLACLAAYALSRFKGRFFAGYSVMLLLLQMFPLMLLLIPLFLIYRTFGIVDTLWSIIISYTCINLPFSIWMLKGFFDTISFDIEEAALVDGCTQIQTMLKIILPISMPGISTVGIFTFLNAWNEYTLASIFLRSDAVQTLTVGLQAFVMQNANDWSGMSAASTIGTIPTLIFLLFAQKYLIQGMTAGSVKG